MQAVALRSASQSAIITKPIAASNLGMNARDNITAMKTGYAQLLINWLCRSHGNVLRPGQERYASDLNGPVQSLFYWAGPNLEPRLFAATPTAVYDVEQARRLTILGSSSVSSTYVPNFSDTTAGAFSETAFTFDMSEQSLPDIVPAIFNTTSGFWSSIQHTNTGVTILGIANGKDGFWLYNGSTWWKATITSAQPNRTLNANKIRGMIVHQRRVFFIEDGTFGVWYLDVDAIQGPARFLDFRPLMRDGKELVAIASQTPTGGRGPSDRLIAVTANGEMIVFAGENPANTATWSLVGIYDVPSPVGERCLMRYGGDLLYASQIGLLEVSALTATPDPERPYTALSDVIRRAYRSAAIAGIDNPAWGLVDNQFHALTLINCPTETGSIQFVKTADRPRRDEGWSVMSGLNALCWVSVGNDLYFGKADGSVFRLGGDTDDGAAITAYEISAFSNFGVGNRKIFSRANLVYDNPSRVKPRIKLVVNFGALPEVPAPTNTFENAKWGWDEITWSLTPLAWTKDQRGQSNAFMGISGNGTSAAFVHAVSAKGPVTYMGGIIMFQKGGMA